MILPANLFLAWLLFASLHLPQLKLTICANVKLGVITDPQVATGRDGGAVAGIHADRGQHRAGRHAAANDRWVGPESCQIASLSAFEALILILSGETRHNRIPVHYAY